MRAITGCEPATSRLAPDGGGFIYPQPAYFDWSSRMMALNAPSPALLDLKRALGASAVALIGGDGRAVAADVPPELLLEPFCIMSATLFGAAVTANEELRLPPPDHVVIHGSGVKTVLSRAGPNGVLVAVVPSASDEGTVLATMRRFLPEPPASESGR